MIDKNDALFLVRLPFGTKTIPYEEVLELIATAKPPGYDPEGVMFELSVIQEDDHLKAAVLRGEVEVLDKSLHRIGLPFIGRLERTVLTVRALREYVESIQGFLEVVEATEPQAAPATDTATPAPVDDEDDAESWKDKARVLAAEIIKRQRGRNLYPSQENLGDEIAREFRSAGIVGADGKPLSGAYIKRHALNGISSAQGKQLSTQTGRGKQGK